MKASIESTDQIVEIDAPTKLIKTGNANGDVLYPTKRVLARVWEGLTDDGVRFVAYISSIQTATKDDNTAFDRDLRDTTKKPNDWTQRAIDLRFFVD